MTFAPDFTNTYPEAFPNPNFIVWQSDEAAPNYWNIVTNAPEQANIEPAITRLNDRTPRLAISDATGEDWLTVALVTQIAFPQTPIRVQVNVPSYANIAPNFDIAYGLTLEVDDKTLWILFGDEPAQGEFEPGFYYYVIPTPRDEWVTQTVDLKAITDSLGFDIRPNETEIVGRFEGLGIFMNRLNFGLLLAARRQAPPSLALAEFGPVANTQLTPSRQAQLTYSLAHPALDYLWRGELALQTDNLYDAYDWYQLALETAPNEAHGYLGLGWTALALDDQASAYTYFLTAQQMIEADFMRYDQEDLEQAIHGQKLSGPKRKMSPFN